MTFDDDFVRVPMMVGEVNIACKSIKTEWPPKEHLTLGSDKGGICYRRVSFSQITDEERAGMTHVARGAQYEYIGFPEDHPCPNVIDISPGAFIEFEKEMSDE